MAKTNINANIGRSLSQTDRILNYMLEGNSITPGEALRKFGSSRLAARISDIEAKGYIVYRQMVNVKTADGNSARVMQYHI